MIIQLTWIGILGIIVVLSLLLSPSQAFASSLTATNYTYDNLGNILQITDNLQPTTYNYSYDDIYRLERVSGGYSSNYIYDADGNILTKNEDQNLTLTYIPSDTIAVHAPKSVNGKILKYDLNGNLIEDAFSNLKITYDYDNRPIEIRRLDTNALLAKYSYDGEGNRVKKEVYTNNVLSKTNEYVNKYFEKEVLVGKPQVIRKFYVGVAYRENGTLTYTTTDHLSSTTLLTTNTGAKQAEHRYYPYGNPIQAATPLPPNSWIGQKRDDESGLYFLNARYYSPSFGRFIQADGEQDALTRGNKYSYTGENPIGRNDAGGLCSMAQPVSTDPSSDCVTQYVVGTITDTLTRITNAIGAMANDTTDGSADPGMTLAALAEIFTLGNTSRTVENWNSNVPIFTDPSQPTDTRIKAAASTLLSVTLYAAQFASPIAGAVSRGPKPGASLASPMEYFADEPMYINKDPLTLSRSYPGYARLNKFNPDNVYSEGLQKSFNGGSFASTVVNDSSQFRVGSANLGHNQVMYTTNPITAGDYVVGAGNNPQGIVMGFKYGGQEMSSLRILRGFQYTPPSTTQLNVWLQALNPEYYGSFATSEMFRNPFYSPSGVSVIK